MTEQYGWRINCAGLPLGAGYGAITGLAVLKTYSREHEDARRM